MNPLLLGGIIALAVAATGQYFFGKRKNKALAGTISVECERVLAPKDKDYVNIGGAIGYNFSYKLADPWTEAKGAMTFAPRMSLLYLPFSYLLGMRDRFFLNIFTKRKLAGEAHLLSASYYRKHGGTIEGRDKLTLEHYDQNGKSFVLLYDDAALAEPLRAVLRAMPEPERLRHFCCYGANRTFFLFIEPKPGLVAAALEALKPRLGDFLR
jgi:hypothetical protein